MIYDLLSSFSELPNDLLNYILLYLPLKNIFKIQSTSKQFENIINNNYLWSLKYPDYTYESFNNSIQLVRNITRALGSPIKIFDCYSTEVIVTSKNDVLFDDQDPNDEYISLCRISHLYDGEKQ